MSDQPARPAVPYRTADAFRRAVVDRIARAAKSSSFSIAQLRRQFAYDRLLTRVFAAYGSQWVLKGAGGLLVRVPAHARHSLDLDLFYQGEMTVAIRQLEQLGADGSFGDYFTFDVTTGARPATRAINVEMSVVAYLGEREFERFRIDLVFSSNMTAPPEIIDVIRPVEIPGLPVSTFRVYPIVDHIADKHAAMIETHGAIESTRYRDLVDLVIIAATQTVEAKALRRAMFSEYAHRGLAAPERVTLPSDRWHDGYRQVAKDVPNLTHRTAGQAVEFVGRMLDPILAGRETGTWNPTTAQWQD